MQGKSNYFYQLKFYHKTKNSYLLLGESDLSAKGTGSHSTSSSISGKGPVHDDSGHFSFPVEVVWNSILRSSRVTADFKGIYYYFRKKSAQGRKIKTKKRREQRGGRKKKESLRGVKKKGSIFLLNLFVVYLYRQKIEREKTCSQVFLGVNNFLSNYVLLQAKSRVPSMHPAPVPTDNTSDSTSGKQGLRLFKRRNGSTACPKRGHLL